MTETNHEREAIQKFFFREATQLVSKTLSGPDGSIDTNEARHALTGLLRACGAVQAGLEISEAHIDDAEAFDSRSVELGDAYCEFANRLLYEAAQRHGAP